jgi:iron(III) transport system substrate-binding protein
MNKRHGKSFFYRLEALKPHVSRTPLDAIDLLTSGECQIAVVPVAFVLAKADEGKPLAVRHPIDGSILVTTPSAVLKNAPHPNGAKLFMEFLMGPTFGSLLAKRRFEVMRSDVKPLLGAKRVTDIKVLRPTATEATKEIAQVAEMWRTIFGK